MIKYMNKDVKSLIGFNYIMNQLQPLTPYGKDKKAEMVPFFNINDLKEELNKVEVITQSIKDNRNIFNQVKSLLAHVKDIRNSLYRAQNDQILTVIELYEIKSFMNIIEDLELLIDKLSFDSSEDMLISSSEELKRLFDPENKELKTYYIYDEYSEALTNIREEKRSLGKQIKIKKTEKKNRLKKELNIRINPKGEVIVSKEDSELNDKISDHSDFEYLSESYMAIRYKVKDGIDIEKLLDRLEELKEREEKEELIIRERLSKEISKHKSFIDKNIQSISNMDLRIAKAYLAMKFNCTRPKITDGNKINIVDGIHPEVQDELAKRKSEFIPISINLSSGSTCITGANMGGKTITLKIIALLTAMAQYGLLVPARQMEASIAEYVYVSIGDLQSIDSGLSTFGGEIYQVKSALGESNRNGLILIDELARGTNPKEGYAISKAIVKFLLDKPSISVITSHYDNVANTEGVVHYQVVGLENLDYDKLKLEMGKSDIHGIEMISTFMDYRLKRVEEHTQVPRDALNIARFMGLQEEVLNIAEDILTRGETNYEK
ncbi:DNA mismatch repair protein MutS [Clostridium sp. D2Q-14]|uniref:lysine 5,6-aminomutase reactivase ATPase KamC n=1 Tax=Anaeromonas gelatinilytica TaxID=2683194 RepID=UPI00193B92F7|nr:DNA mismatch repair protein MutS [Anaeromonas gelatinilytica]MBS4534928.1 DNA mismatch repair protein MutS [Anaeromonas gelatinilytica]